MTPETEAYAGLLCSHLQAMTTRLRLLTPEQWDWTPVPSAPTARQLASHTWQWLVCDRQHITETDVHRHPLVPDVPREPMAVCELLEEEAACWKSLILGLQPWQMDAWRRQFNRAPITVRGFVCHVIQNSIYKHGQLATLFFALGLDGTGPYNGPMPNPFYASLAGAADENV